jgi:aspartate ammonia-lyase
MSHRIEKDSIGPVKVPSYAYYGSFTARALENFQISDLKAPKEFRVALGIVKKAAAKTNMELGELDQKHAKAIIQAADEFIAGKFDDEFSVDIYQAGAGTPFNMNANELLANRANELLGGKKGKYDPITPNNHINWGQSSNDVIPTSIRIAALNKLEPLKKELSELIKSFDNKANEYKNLLKIGRTHLQDAVPITLGQVLDAYSEALKKDLKFINECFEKLTVISIGGTALGTGITSHPEFKNRMIKNLNKLSGLKLKSARSMMEMTQNVNSFAMASSSLKMLSHNLIRICEDLRILASGPKGGISEIELPEAEPGSSIMPGKVNPSIPECVSMVGYQVIGNDTVISYSAQSSKLELNVMTPLILHNLLQSMSLLTNASSIFNYKCIKGLKANKEQCLKLLDESLCFATGLSSYLGYKATAEIVKEGLKKKKTLKETVMSKKFMSQEELDFILSIDNLVKPTINDKKLIEKIKKNKNYNSYLKKIQ